ncbi:hypothetical protein BDV23DRAFT_105079 [Aspergillus alliaceus]|uniref:Uncharacterized protein n=1 Tax=Petromyces alliaceus TaxID=209559 RepID=A0A5N6G6H6_PETAA|nr:uncharacterized protein BDW43DRAFT_225183 [Aspergillus alliaceus]KAB8236794.1 hypothetical protein BDW43DRAFT_225183 [Aspergillus alliaceus]KAE8395335.1 hypothetical protein BDV23DRAFT_105079 [Aspergillus alliaceus]
MGAILQTLSYSFMNVSCSLMDLSATAVCLPTPIGLCRREAWFQVEMVEWHLFLNLRRTVNRYRLGGLHRANGAQEWPQAQ